MKLTAGRNRRARTWLLCGLLVSTCFAAIGWQYAQSVRQERLNRSLLNAISSQQAVAVQRMLRAGANPNTCLLPDTPPPPPWQVVAATVRRLWRHERPAPRPVYPTALLMAMGPQDVVAPNVQIIQCLLDAGADPNTIGPMQPYENSDTPLIWALRSKQTRVVRLLLNHHANPSILSDEGETCLNYAVQFESGDALALTSLLLQHGADINARRNRVGETPLITATESGSNFALIKLLLDRGADASAQGPEGQTPLFAILDNDPAFNDSDTLPGAEYLIDAGADLNAKDINGTTPLMKAAASDNQALVKLLLKYGAKVSLRDHEGESALIYAVDFPEPLEQQVWNKSLEGYVWNEPLNTATLLLSSGANVNDTGFAKTLLASGVVSINHHYSKPSLLPRLIHFLRHHKANINIKDSQGTTPLMVCSQTESPEAVRLLLAQGADVNARDDDGYTALMSAANGGHLAVTRLLLAHGAEKSARDLNGRTNLDRPQKGLFVTYDHSELSNSVLGRKFAQLFEHYP